MGSVVMGRDSVDPASAGFVRRRLHFVRSGPDLVARSAVSSIRRVFFSFRLNLRSAKGQ